jgi:hypothetical protein
MEETSRTLQYAEMNGRGTMKEDADIASERGRLHICSSCFVLSRWK